VLTVAVTTTPDELWDLAGRSSHTWLPVLDAGGRVLGVLSLLDALRVGRDACPPVAQLMHPPVTLATNTPLRAALTHLQQTRAALAVVVDKTGKPMGVVTAKDLVEPITGELSSW
jgi:CBS domain containing-hemolysin-like protein